MSEIAGPVEGGAMFRLFTKLDEGATIRELLALEELKGEQIRGRTLMGIFAALFIVALGAKYILLPRLPSAMRYLGDSSPHRHVRAASRPDAADEALFYAFLSRLVARRTTVFLHGPRYGTSHRDRFRHRHARRLRPSCRRRSP